MTAMPTAVSANRPDVLPGEQVNPHLVEEQTRMRVAIRMSTESTPR
jgi:hypothetical protein